MNSALATPYFPPRKTRLKDDSCNTCNTNDDLNRQLLRKRAELETLLIQEKRLTTKLASILENKQEMLSQSERELDELKQRYMLLHRAYDQLREQNEDQYED